MQYLNLKKKTKMLTMTNFKINTNIRLLMKQPSEKIFKKSFFFDF